MGDSTQLAQERGARDRVIRAAANDGCRRVEVDSGTEHSRERVGPSASLQSELVWPGRLVERLGGHPCKTAWHEVPEGDASGNAADTASRLAERSEAGEAQSGSNGHARPPNSSSA